MTGALFCCRPYGLSASAARSWCACWIGSMSAARSVEPRGPRRQLEMFSQQRPWACTATEWCARQPDCSGSPAGRSPWPVELARTTDRRRQQARRSSWLSLTARHSRHRTVTVLPVTPLAHRETAFRQWRPISALTTIRLKRTNPLAICGAIKERRTAFPDPDKELSAKPKNNQRIDCPATGGGKAP